MSVEKPAVVLAEPSRKAPPPAVTVFITVFCVKLCLSQVPFSCVQKNESQLHIVVLSSS